MIRIRTLTLALATAVLFCLAATCDTASEENEEAQESYGEEGAEQQTMDEQMEEVQEQINR